VISIKFKSFKLRNCNLRGKNFSGSWETLGRLHAWHVFSVVESCSIETVPTC